MDASLKWMFCQIVIIKHSMTYRTTSGYTRFLDGRKLPQWVLHNKIPKVIFCTPINAVAHIISNYCPSDSPETIMNILSIILLCFCSIVSSRSQIQEVLSNKTGRGGRFLGLFTVVQFTDEECLSEPHGGMRPIGKN